MSAVEIRGLSKAYGSTPVLHDVDLTVPEGQITAILGASGSGKTTLLRVVAGFEDADAGTVAIGGTAVDDGRRTVRAQHRAVGYVPQDAALFPHLSVAGNIRFGVPRRQRSTLGALIATVGLTGYEQRMAHELSGGQQQRVALARALATDPRVVLLDEPFGSLDAGLRETVRADVAAILASAGATTVLVTHDQDEALSLASRVALLAAGRVVACGEPRDLYRRPATPEIALAIGTATILPGRYAAGGVQCSLGELGRTGGPQHADGERCQVLIRPEQVEVTAGDASAGGSDEGLLATVVQIRFHGSDTDVEVATADGIQLVARHTGPDDLRAGQRVHIRVRDQLHTWRVSDQARSVGGSRLR